MTIAKKKIGFQDMGEFMASEADNIFPQHGEDIMQMIDDECPQICSERFRPELQAPARLLVYSLATSLIEKLVDALFTRTLDVVKKRTGSPGLKSIK